MPLRGLNLICVDRRQHTGTLSRTQPPRPDGLTVSTLLSPNDSDSDTSRPPYTVTAPARDATVLTTAGESPSPPSFSSLFFPSEPPVHARNKPNEPTQQDAPPAFAPAPPFTESASSAATAAATKAVLPRDNKASSSSSKDIDDGEPPPPYSEGSSPLDSFTYVMATAGGPASIITQVSQGSAPPVNALGGEN